ncbi:MAG: hypothetical protein JO076_14055, partial [Verrucomicrobia bacterium]|nr:hypothetical protein [Verrucomicrobiota bacterium]
MPNQRKGRYVLYGLLTLIVLIAVFYQPIAFGILGLVAKQVARSQSFVLHFKVDGSIFTDIHVEDLHLEPLPNNTTLPIARLDAKVFRARYNLLRLFQKDYRHVVTSLEIKDVTITIRPTPPQPPPLKKRAGPPIPLIVPERLDIQNVNFSMPVQNDSLEVLGLSVALARNQSGALNISHLSIPQVGRWDNLHALLNYKDDRLSLSGLALAPI